MGITTKPQRNESRGRCEIGLAVPENNAGKSIGGNRRDGRCCRRNKRFSGAPATRAKSRGKELFDLGPTLGFRLDGQGGSVHVVGHALILRGAKKLQEKRRVGKR